MLLGIRETELHKSDPGVVNTMPHSDLDLGSHVVYIPGYTWDPGWFWWGCPFALPLYVHYMGHQV